MVNFILLTIFEIDSIWNVRSDLVKNLIRGMMNVNTEERFSAKQALEHPWIQ